MFAKSEARSVIVCESSTGGSEVKFEESQCAGPNTTLRSDEHEA